MPTSACLTGLLTDTCKGARVNCGRTWGQKVRIIQEGSITGKKNGGENWLKDSLKLGSVKKCGYWKTSVQGRMRMMMGKMWGRCYVPGSGKLYGRFLGPRASVAHRRAYFVPCAELSSAAVCFSPLHHPWSATGSPWQSPCRDSCVERQEGHRWRQRATSTRRKSCKGKWPRVTPHEVGWTPRKAAGAVPVTSPPVAAGTKNNKAGWANLFLIYYLNLTACKPHDSLAVPALLQRLAAKSTQDCEYSFLCHLLAGNLPAASPWLPRDRLLGVRGGAVWAEPLGWLLEAIIRRLGTGRWSFRRHW